MYYLYHYPSSQCFGKDIRKADYWASYANNPCQCGTLTTGLVMQIIHVIVETLTTGLVIQTIHAFAKTLTTGLVIKIIHVIAESSSQCSGKDMHYLYH
jgi:hypothetical protein